jgi:hypothetical protein
MPITESQRDMLPRHEKQFRRDIKNIMKILLLANIESSRVVVTAENFGIQSKCLDHEHVDETRNRSEHIYQPDSDENAERPGSMCIIVKLQKSSANMPLFSYGEGLFRGRQCSWYWWRCNMQTFPMKQMPFFPKILTHDLREIIEWYRTGASRSCASHTLVVRTHLRRVLIGFNICVIVDWKVSTLFPKLISQLLIMDSIGSCEIDDRKGLLKEARLSWVRNALLWERRAC